MLLQILAQSFAQDSHAAAMDNSNPRQTRQKCPVQELFYFARGLFDGVANHIDFRWHILVFGLERNRNAAGAGGLYRGIGGAR